MRKILFLLLITGIPINSIAQELLSIDDIFKRADLNPKYQRGIDWIPNSNNYCFSNDDRSLYLSFNVSGNKVDTLFRPEDLLSGLKKIPSIHWIDKSRITFEDKGITYFYNLDDKKGVYKKWEQNDAESIELHDNSENIAYVKDKNLFIYSKGKSLQISKDGGQGIVYASAVHRQEFGITKGTFWSPSGDKLAFYRMDESMVTDYPLVSLESSPAKETPFKYPMAGQTSHQVSLGVYDIISGKTIYVKTEGPDDHYLTNIAWSPDEKFILIAELNRDQNKMKLNQYAVSDGSFVKTLFIEEDPQWVEPENPALFVNGFKDQFLWQSERNGFNHLYLCNLDGKMIRHFDIGKEVVTEVLGMDPAGNSVFVMVTANSGLDRQCLRIDLNGKSQTISQGSGVHSMSWNSMFSYYIDTFTNLETPGKVSLNDSKGAEIKVISEASDPIAMQALPKPVLVQVKAKDGTVLNGRLFKPLNIKEGKQYPVIIYVYGGPHAQMVTNRWLGGGNLWMSWMASQGFGVFTLDNRGSADRGLEFEQVIHNQLGVAEMEDQMLGVDYLKSLKWVDQGRIGVHGWSFGGFMTTSLLCKYPGVFKAGVAGGPVIDWKLYEVMYTERYMDTPATNSEGYEQANLLNVAKDLKDRLMLIHGTIDNVVVWQHSQLMVKACVDNDVLIDYMIYPGHEHNVRGKDRLHLYKTISRHLMENLEEIEY
ncbi:MAG: DPP IV N-terminal domain-containing protein [Bacteroidia bacterium]